MVGKGSVRRVRGSLESELIEGFNAWITRREEVGAESSDVLFKGALEECPREDLVLILECWVFA